eukprot:TRINITY_DN60100_c0_g1_i1.p1 TRINITY_DN60100_c0_g1~~TRINITY_DN60100_c0_g1_i1.p1  ORF type:complete len:627 (-),score=139.37 TRINITY_DN60100_c0_g1_i1:172-2052(-)
MHGGGRPPVSDDVAAEFLDACQREYVQGVKDAVGTFLDANRLGDEFDAFEDQLRAARDRAAFISAARQRWGLTRPPSRTELAAAPVPADAAEAFLVACEKEYVKKMREMVGKFFDEAGFEDELAPFEDQVREAQNPAAVIASLRLKWGQAPSQPGNGAASNAAPPKAPITQSVVNVQQRLQSMRSAMKLPAATRDADVVLAGLRSGNPDLMWLALGAAPSVGLGSSDEARTAEAQLRRSRQLPDDWNMGAYAAGKVLEGSSGGRQASTIIAYEKQPERVVETIQGLLDSTYRKVFTRDRRGAPIPDRFKVLDVHRVMNDQIWREYSKHREEVGKRCQGSAPTVPGGALRTMQYLQSKTHPCLPTLDAAVNEAWLFHGTKREAAEGIAENDFRLDLTGSNAGTLYGKGIYLAENVTKSDEYGEGPDGPASEEREGTDELDRPPPGPPPSLIRESYILVCRSSLGRMKYTDERRPDANLLQKGALKGDYESVMGDRLKKNGTFREIVVYDDDLVYPEYIVRYERIFFHERFAEIFQAQRQRKIQNRYQGPTSEEEQVMRSLWHVYSMPHHGKINKWQLLELLKAVGQPPENEGADLVETFKEWDTKKDGWIDEEEFFQEMQQRVIDGF